MVLIVDGPAAHGLQEENSDWEEWSEAEQVFIVPEPPNSSTITSALDLEIFGEEQRLVNKVNNLISILYANEGRTNYVLNTSTLELDISCTDTRTALERAGGKSGKLSLF